MKLLSRTKYFLLVCLVLFNSCTEETDSEALIFTEEVIFVSGEILRVTGRVVSGSTLSISDHGFQVSTTESFDSPIIISLGERDVPGRYIGTHENLNTGTDYFVRAFMVIEGETRVGEAVAFSTLNSQLTSFSPEFENVGVIINVFGQNLTTDAEVYFGEVKAEIVEFKFESVLRVRVPTPREGQYTVPIRVISDGNELIFDDNFEYVIGKWTEASVFPGPTNFQRNTFFVAEGKLYAGMEDQGGNVNRFWVYDPNTESWDEVDFNLPFVLNPGLFEGGFLGGLTNQGLSVTSLFWTLENGQLVRQPNAPFFIHRAATFREGNHLYVFGGVAAGAGDNTIVFRYDFARTQWVEYDVAPIEISSLRPSFAHDGKMYFLDENGALFRYDPALRAWDEISQYPGEVVNLALGVTIGDYAYVGVGSRDRGIFEYEFATNTWKEKVAMPGFNTDITTGWFVINDRLYVLRNRSIGNRSTVLWEFEPFNF